MRKWRLVLAVLAGMTGVCSAQSPPSSPKHDRGRPSHVLLTAEEYDRITSGQKSIADLVAMPEAAEVEFEPPRLIGDLHEETDFS